MHGYGYILDRDCRQPLKSQFLNFCPMSEVGKQFSHCIDFPAWETLSQMNASKQQLLEMTNEKFLKSPVYSRNV